MLSRAEGEPTSPRIVPTISPLALLEKYKLEHPEDFLPQPPEESFEIIIKDAKFTTSGSQLIVK